MKRPNILYTAVKALIKNDEGKVLVLKQSDPTITGANQYHPPGGIVELGETVAECIVREVEEEAGVKSVVKHLFGVGEWRAERGDEINTLDILEPSRSIIQRFLQEG
jgi:ADP-ribose pyrophosphatase YjhB (NUDIX family)